MGKKIKGKIKDEDERILAEDEVATNRPKQACCTVSSIHSAKAHSVQMKRDLLFVQYHMKKSLVIFGVGDDN